MVTDKERILMTILKRLCSTQKLCCRPNGEEKFRDGDSEYVHFGEYDDRRVKKGDLVLGQTGGVSDFTVGFVEEVYSDSHMLIREIGTDRTCNYSNEMFVRIHIENEYIREKDEYQFYLKVLKAFRRGDKYRYRYGGINFLEDGMVEVWIREAFGGLRDSFPFSMKMKWDKRTTIKEILQNMIDVGYGVRDFSDSSQKYETARIDT